jgi:hypothetical protein
MSDLQKLCHFLAALVVGLWGLNLIFKWVAQSIGLDSDSVIFFVLTVVTGLVLAGMAWKTIGIRLDIIAGFAPAVLCVALIPALRYWSLDHVGGFEIDIRQAWWGTHAVLTFVPLSLLVAGIMWARHSTRYDGFFR